MTLEEASQHAGEKVVYSDRPGQMEVGVIARTGRKYAYVRYARMDGTLGRPVATHPSSLTLMIGDTLREHVEAGMAEAGFPLAGDGEPW